MLVANIELKKPKKIDGTIVNDIPPPSPRPSTPVDRTGTQESSDSVNVVSPSTSAITAGTTETRKYYLVRSCRNIPLEDGVIGIGWDKINFSKLIMRNKS